MHYELGYGKLAYKIKPVESIYKFIFVQFVFVESIKLKILNELAPVLQNVPNGNLCDPIDIEYRFD